MYAHNAYTFKILSAVVLQKKHLETLYQMHLVENLDMLD